MNLKRKDPSGSAYSIATEVRVGGLLLPLYTSRGRAARVSAARWHRVVPPGRESAACHRTTRYYRQSRLSRLAGLQASWHAPRSLGHRPLLLDCAPAPLPAGYRGVVDCTRGPKPRYMAQATAPKVRLPRVPDTP